MNPAVSDITENQDIFRFRISGINVSLANALRRIILNDIDTVVFRTETYNDSQCTIYINTCRLHNEIVKQRLSCIPIHSTDLGELPNKYIMELDVQNDTDHIIYVTSKDFRIKNKETGNYLTEKETRKIFPPCKLTGQYIDFVRLRPSPSSEIPGEQIKLSCEFSVANVDTNSMFNVVSKCAYSFTNDATKAAQAWTLIADKMASDGATKAEIEFAHRNFNMLDAERYYVENSFDFVLQSVGVFSCVDIVKKACAVMQRKLLNFIEALDAGIVPVLATEVSSHKTTMENCYDVILENEDYTLGKSLEFYLYDTYFEGRRTLSFCGFKKMHPHDTHSRVRIAFKEPADKTVVKALFREAAVKLQDVFVTIHKRF